LVLLFVNVSDQELTAACAFDASGYGMAGEAFAVEALTAEGGGQKQRDQNANDGNNDQ
jgi:hypothetical protein